MARLGNHSIRRTVPPICRYPSVAIGMTWTKGAFGRNVLANMFVLNVLEIIQQSNVQGYLSQVDVQFARSLLSTNAVYQASPDTVTVCYLLIQNLCWL